MKILGIDIETAPNLVYSWGLFNQNIGHQMVVEPSRVLCFAYKWFSEEGAEVGFESEVAVSNANMMGVAHELLDRADVVVHYNGTRFDTKMLNREFLKLGWGPPAPYKQVDLFKAAKKYFRFPSNKLDAILKELEIGEKVKHSGFALWKGCMDGDPAAWEEMESYARGDVEPLEELYLKIRPWMTNHPNHGLYVDPVERTCTNCGSTKIQSRGYAYTKTLKYPRYYCTDCGTWLKGRSTVSAPSTRENVLTQVV